MEMLLFACLPPAFFVYVNASFFVLFSKKLEKQDKNIFDHDSCA